MLEYYRAFANKEIKPWASSDFYNPSESLKNGELLFGHKPNISLEVYEV